MFFCRDHETCILDDDMQQIYPKFVDMDGLILATPVMTMGIPGTLKAFMDRFQVFFMAKYLRNQSLISPERKGKTGRPFHLHIRNGYPGSVCWRKTDRPGHFSISSTASTGMSLLINGMDTIRDIATRPELLDAAYKKGICPRKIACSAVIMPALILN